MKVYLEATFTKNGETIEVGKSKIFNFSDKETKIQHIKELEKKAVKKGYDVKKDGYLEINYKTNGVNNE